MNASTSVPNPVAATLLDARDDVATALRDLAAGTNVAVAAGTASHAILLREPIRTGHKFAVRALAAGQPVRKYGEVIGNLVADVAPGSWVHVHNLETAAHGSPGDARASRAQATPGSGSATPGANAHADPARAKAPSPRTFMGYRRPDGRVGVRNHVLVLSPTGLTSAAAQRVAALVHGTVCVTTGYGRGQVAADARLQVDTLAGLAAHPNVAAVVVLSAADDISRTYLDAIAPCGKPALGLTLPGVHEDALALVDAGVRAATRFVRDASALQREPCDIAELCVAVECGHSDATSGLVCNPLAGRILEQLVAAGGRAMFSETVEWTGAEHLLAQRAASPEVAQHILAAVAARERMAHDAGGSIRGQNPGQQNKEGGLTTLEEKALGAIAKGGRQTIRGVLRPAQVPSAAGLYLMDTPFFSPESITAMVAGGAQVVLFTTGAGNSYASLIAPTMKMSANPATCARLTEQIDFDATAALAGTATLDQLGEAGLERVLAIAGGLLTFGEIAGEGSEVVSRLGPSM